MITVAAIAVAVGAQAACVDWGSDTDIINPETSETADGWAAYYFASGATIAGSETYLSRTALIEALGTENFADVVSSASGFAAVDYGYIGTSSDDVFATGTTSDDNIVTGYVVIFNAADVADATKAFVSAEGDCAKCI